MSADGWEVMSVEPVHIAGPSALDGKRLISPYVWGETPDRLSMLVRAVGDPKRSTGSIWLAHGSGLAFRTGDAPLLAPGPEAVDCCGCEDPTFVHVPEGCLVYYTGLNSDGAAQLLYAEGPSLDALAKGGVAHASTTSDRNTKEAAVECLGDRWLLLFEYSRDGCSRIGRAEAGGPAGPWQEHPDPLLARPGKWDSGHLSTGPLLVDQPGGPLMFYNGADGNGNWAIGWVRFDDACTRAVARAEEPLIAPPSNGSAPNGDRIAFAASAVRSGEEIWLYYSCNDRETMRAVLREC